MKRISLILLSIIMVISCQKDDLSWMQEIESIKTELSNQKQLIDALQSNANIISIESNDDSYTIIFSGGQSITLSSGKTPLVSIGENGNWFINGQDTGMPSRGKDGDDGTDGKDGHDGSNGNDGKDGITPKIEIIDGYWWLNDKNTGIKAEGKDGKDGKDGDTFFKGVTIVDGYVIFILNDGNNTQLKLPLNYEDISNAEIIIPSKLVFMQNKVMDIMYNNILYRADADKLGFKRLGSSTLYGYAQGDRFRILQPNVGNGSATLFMQRYSDVSYELTQKEQSNLITKSFIYSSISPTQGKGQTKKVMFIGDSITANGVYANEIENLFKSDEMNVELIGTLGASVKHEGRGGWSAKTYCTIPTFNSYTNAFWNPSTSRFDFSYYMSKNGFSGVDYVFINLGINDVFAYSENNNPGGVSKPLTKDGLDSIIGYYNEMIASIKKYNANVKIFIGLPIPPATYDFAVNASNNPYVDCSYDSRIMKADRLGLIKRLLQEYDNRENEGFVIVPLNCVIDTTRDFPTIDLEISDRDNTKIPYLKDMTHPKEQGYLKLADVIFTYIKYGTTL